ncbi:MAG TPA: diphthamide biosynthesis enzyme Dph2 [Thermoplasmata archaeon]|nr:diphthamide biosynthesis enzyme Dph2 [Thermoplasmata archaeon]
MEDGLEIDLEEIENEMSRVKPKTVLLQLPSGLKRKAMTLSSKIQERFGCEVLISGDSCFGSCDIPSGSLDLVDAVIQVGHWEMPTVKLSKPVMSLPVEISIDLLKLIKTAKPILRSPVGLLATSQHLHQLNDAKSMLEKEGLKVMIGKGERRVPEPGLLLGCDYSSARAISDEVASFLLLGGGRFHAIGLKLSTGKPVVILDPERSAAIAEDIDVDAFKRKRYSVIQAISKAKSIGILVSSKPGQERMLMAKRLLSSIIDSGREGHIVVLNDVSPDALLNLGLDAYISTACPRIALDDSDSYGVALGTPIELMIALSKVKWEDYAIDEWGADPTNVVMRHA